jgi:osmotically-inducible protein OsmY
MGHGVRMKGEVMGEGQGRGMEQEKPKKTAGQIALRVSIAGAIAFGALASGFLVSRRGRRFLRDVWDEKRRTPLEDRVIDTIWGHPRLGRRKVDVVEVEPGVIAVVGVVRTPVERRALLRLASKVKGVLEIEDRLEVRPRAR